MGIWRLPAIVLGTAAVVWGGAEVLLQLRGAGQPPTAPSRIAVAPAQPAALPRDKAEDVVSPGPDKARPPEAAGPGKASEPARPLPRVITPDGMESPGRAPLLGPTRVADGDSLEVGGIRVRLVGIDAPELHQTCRDREAQVVLCGQLARAMLEELALAGPVACTPLDTDRFDRILALCRNAREEMNRAMVRAGWAFAYEGDPTYLAEEQAAARAGRGIHALRHDRPAAWRRANPR